MPPHKIDPKTHANSHKGRQELRGADARAQATAMMVERLFGGATTKSLALKYGVTTRTIDNRTALARREGIPEEVREVFLRELLPMSMAVLREALAGEDLRLATSVAMKIVTDLEALKAPTDRPTIVEESFELYRTKFTQEKDDARGLANRTDSLSTDNPAGYLEAEFESEQPAVAEAGTDAGSNERAEAVLVPGNSDWHEAAQSEADSTIAGSASSEASVSAQGAENAPADQRPGDSE